MSLLPLMLSLIGDLELLLDVTGPQCCIWLLGAIQNERQIVTHVEWMRDTPGE